MTPVEPYSETRRLKRLSEVPRRGIKPGLEVPETSLMSFSLPGRAVRGPIIVTG